MQSQDQFDEFRKIAAANAITILNLQRHSFSGLNLSYVKIPNANLSFGIFQDTDFTGADLSGCDFSNAILDKANFTGANLTGVKFENIASFQYDSGARCLTLSDDQSKVIVGYDSGRVVCWDIKSGDQLFTVNCHKK